MKRVTLTQEQQQKINELSKNVANNGDCTRTFEVDLTGFVNSLPDNAVLLSLLTSTDKNRKYVGIYGLSIYYRHLMEYDDLEQLLDEYEQEFSTFQSIGHLRTLFYLDSEEEYSHEEVQEHLNKAFWVAKQYKDMAKRFPNINVAGSQHAFADLFATYCERYESLQSEIVGKWYKKAHSAVEEAIRLSPEYAKYYCTKGRILSQMHDYDTAFHCVQKAIRLESPTANKDNYSLRILQYQSHKVNIQARYQIYKLNTQQAKINDDISNMKGSLLSNIEILGFFSGIISFIIGSLTLANGQTAKDAAALILILLGALLVVFDCFGFLLHANSKNTLVRIIVLILGVSIVVGGVCVVW